MSSAQLSTTYYTLLLSLLLIMIFDERFSSITCYPIILVSHNNLYFPTAACVIDSFINVNQAAYVFILEHALLQFLLISIILWRRSTVGIINDLIKGKTFFCHQHIIIYLQYTFWLVINVKTFS